MDVFVVTSYPWRAFWASISIATLLPLTVVGVTLAAADIIPGWLYVFALAVPLGFMFAVSLALIAVLLYSISRNEITSRKGTIHLKGGGFHERVELATITRAEVVDIAKNKALAPAKRENGLRLPGFQVGWCTLTDGTHAFVMRTLRKRMVFIETDQNFRVLLAVKDPERLLAHIKTSGG